MFKKAVWSDTRAACCILWVTMTIVWFPFSQLRLHTLPAYLGKCTMSGFVVFHRGVSTGLTLCKDLVNRRRGLIPPAR